MLPSKIKTFLFKHKIKVSVIFLIALVYWWWLPSKLFDKPCSTVLVDANNQLLSAQIASDGQWRYPQNDSIPAKFAQCITLFEDEYFYKHPGINPFSILKSIKRNVNSNKIKINHKKTWIIYVK